MLESHLARSQANSKLWIWHHSRRNNSAICYNIGITASFPSQIRVTLCSGKDRHRFQVWIYLICLVPMFLAQNYTMLYLYHGVYSISSVGRLVMSSSLWSHGLLPARVLCRWDFPGKNTRVGFHVLLQGIFPTQESNLGLLHCTQILYHLSYPIALVHINCYVPCVENLTLC